MQDPSRELAAHSTSQRSRSPRIFSFFFSFFFFVKFTIPVQQLLAILVSIHKGTSRRKNNSLFKGCLFEGKHLMLERNNICRAFKGALSQLCH